MSMNVVFVLDSGLADYLQDWNHDAATDFLY